MSWRPHGYANINPTKPEALGTCDRCNFVYNLNDLVWQYDYRGPNLTNIRLRVCKRTCLDRPYQGWRPLKLPADPVPVRDPRPINAAVQEQTTPPTSPTYWDEPGILWDSGETWAP